MDMDSRIRAAARRNHTSPSALDQPAAEPAEDRDPDFSGGRFSSSWTWWQPRPSPEADFRAALVDAHERATRSARLHL